MQIDVGPFRYCVRLVHGHIEHEGQHCYGLCDNLAQLILISDVPTEKQRLSVFFHELMHAWWYHFGIDPADEEAVADLVGVAMTQFVDQVMTVLRGRGESGAALASALAAPARDRASTDAAAGGKDRCDGTPGAAAVARLQPVEAEPDAKWVIRLYDPDAWAFRPAAAS
ncbi:MAG: hypothetical protein GC162_09945 [Planctomycetes bacterium]|nr:hypothetical protein [Planctomycetota bacterium]